MPHLFHDLDFTVSIFVTHRGRVPLVKHKKLKAWLPLGGYIEIGEDPEQAALREAREKRPRGRARRGAAAAGLSGDEDFEL